jgi:hypothetical protein
MKKSNHGGTKKMKNQNNKPIDRIKEGRISLLRWENTNGDGEVFTSFSLNKTMMRKNEDEPSKFEGQVFSLNGLTKHDLESIKEVIGEIQEGEERKGWSQ